MLKFDGRLEGDHVMHFLSCTKRLITWSLVCKCSYGNDRIKGGPMMWVSSTMEGNRQKGKWLVKEFKALKWAKANNVLPPRIILLGSHGKWDDYDIYFTIMMTVKHGKHKCI